MIAPNSENNALSFSSVVPEGRFLMKRLFDSEVVGLVDLPSFLSFLVTTSSFLPL
jgi:hypothetical protein